METLTLDQGGWIQWILLALVQGLTEYLPVSSSAHLVLTSKILAWKDQGLVIDIAAHSGSLIAVMWFFREEIKDLLSGKKNKLLMQLILASIPIALAGALLASQIETHLRSSLVIATTSIVFGVLLYLADILGKKNKQNINTKSAVSIGFAQVLALIPGTSRSGVTMTAALAMGYSRTQAARFSFLLAIPVLMMTSAYAALKLYQTPQSFNASEVGVVSIVSFFASLICIKLFLGWIEKIGMQFFMWYRVALGLIIFLVVL